ncbi:hypothetical protein V6N13_131064 [Hibiscus sabdariffa]|uniref:Zinc-ribbon domain-containing protein n=1 Tax=Hibiscus sabdariffa TaxID=183260 RepID=A0ABR2D6S7_9ROSI
MGSGTTPRVRLVRCPKCRLLLPEVEDVPVYMCGGCDTILVAKYRKAIVESMSLLQETGAADSDKSVHVSENGEFSSSTPQEVHLSQESGSRCGNLDENLSNEGRGNDRNTSRDIDYKCEKLDENGSGQLQSGSSEDCHVQQQGVSIECFSPTKHHENEELMVEEPNYKTSRLDGAYSESKSNNKIDSNIRDSSFDDQYAARETSLTAGEVISSDVLFSSPNELMEQPRRREHRVFDHGRSTDSFETLDFVSPGTELSDPELGYLSKSTTTRTSHTFDGSISSYDDQFLDQQIHSFKNNYKASNYLVPEERQRKDKLPAKGLMNGNARNLSSDLSNRKPYGKAKYSKWRRDEEALEPVMHQRPPGSWTKLVREEYPSPHPFSQRESLRGYENAGPSRGLHDELPDSEQENMKLLRMVHELQDQISKTCNLNGRKPRGRASIDAPWRQKHRPTYYYHEGNQLYPRHEIDNSCIHCHPQRWPHSEWLPPPMFRHSQGFCRAHSGHNCYNCYSYCPSSPLRYLESDFPGWSHDNIYGAKRYSRDEHYIVRRHQQPTAGGAPFVACYHCFRPLELPADFLLSKRRFHQLRCGACLKVLTFSLQNGNHLVPYQLVGSRTSTM